MECVNIVFWSIPELLCLQWYKWDDAADEYWKMYWQKWENMEWKLNSYWLVEVSIGKLNITSHNVVLSAHDLFSFMSNCVTASWFLNLLLQVFSSYVVKLNQLLRLGSMNDLELLGNRQTRNFVDIICVRQQRFLYGKLLVKFNQMCQFSA